MRKILLNHSFMLDLLISHLFHTLIQYLTVSIDTHIHLAYVKHMYTSDTTLSNMYIFWTVIDNVCIDSKCLLALNWLRLVYIFCTYIPSIQFNIHTHFNCCLSFIIITLLHFLSKSVLPSISLPQRYNIWWSWPQLYVHKKLTFYDYL